MSELQTNDELIIDPTTIESAVLRRLIEEVQMETSVGGGVTGYNRIHNRHNRSK